MQNQIRVVFLLSFVLFTFHTFSQEYRLNQGPLSALSSEKVLMEKDEIIHLGIRPLWVNNDLLIESEKKLIHGGDRKKKKRLIGRKLFDEHFLHLKKEDFTIRIDPILNLQAGRDLNDSTSKNLTTNSRGIRLSGNITDKVSFYSSYIESQSFFPTYLSTFVDSNQVVPGAGSIKKFKTTGYDYSEVVGVVRYKANNNLQFVFGQDRLFFGHGYRSVLLSDNSFTYPFLNINVHFFKHKLLYSTSYAWLMKREKILKISAAEALFKRKQANYHYLSYKPNKLFEIGIFQGVIWKRWDEQKGTISVNGAFYSPVIFTSLLANPKEEEHTSVLGANLLFNPMKNMSLYAQFAQGKDDNAYQAGMKWYSPFNWSSWFFQMEYNFVGEKTYLNQKAENSNYNHYNQGITTPISDYNEIVSRLAFHKSYWVIQGKINIQKRGLNSSAKENLQILEGELGYLINPKYNLMIFAGGMLRNSDLIKDTFWGFAGIKTNLTNRYYDF